MSRRLRVHLIDDDPAIVDLVREALELLGHDVQVSPDGEAGLTALDAAPPDLVILDLMMPGMDGAEVCRRIRANPRLEAVCVIVLSAKVYPADRQAAMEAGADAYTTKPVRIDRLREIIDRVIQDRLRVRFWGVRGTLPAPSAENVRYGGNTSCVTVHFPRGQLFVLDAGTGIRVLGDALLKGSRDRLSGAILLTHPHWDHINALPFFGPLYVPGNQFQICGPAQPGASVRDLVAAQMDGRFFPITPREFGADVTYTDLRQGEYRIQDVEVRTMMLMHPGVCLGYRLQYRGRSVCYVTDQELYLPDSPFHTQEYVDRLVRFLSGADVLITDTTYTDSEYPSRVGWGHTCVSQVAMLAHRAGVKKLCVFHHDPSQSDVDIDQKLAATRDALAALGSTVEALAPAEGDELLV
jgi:CheY-like chemotaxis protein